MNDFILLIILGVILSVIGIINMTGNISTLHKYHRKRVREEDKKTFGKLVGLGTLLIGIAIIAYDVLNLLSEQAAATAYSVLGTVVLGLGIVLGLALNFYAMIKYNKGIF